MPSNPSAGVDTERPTRLEKEVREPARYRVLLHNDNYTTMEFVVAILRSIFRRTLEDATAIMLDVHQHGIGQCGVFTREVAETKVAQVHNAARKAGFPLKCSLEKL